ncbi:hypothetical protein B0H14DRAFT_2363268 [Mycena olivaceomarginata]|nr:hypothetical protein B0H14DRAFT_2363268 [Mycena olivaceomarginata]
MAESASERYARLLFPQKLGYPLFLPQLSDDIIPGWRKTGIRIGHVGVVRADGSFDPIFNIFPYPQDVDPNPKDVPTNFKALRFEDFRDPAPFISRRVRHEPGADISNDVIGKRRLDGNAGVNSNVFLPIGADAAIEVSTNSEELALLLLPDGSSSLELRPLEVFEDYAKKHAVDWYQFVNGVLKYRIKNGDLYLVTAVIRAKSWSVATKHKNSGDRQFTLKLQAAQVGAAGASCSWEWEGRSSSLDSGPKRPADEDPTWNNQTVFFSGFKVKLRSQRLKVWQPGYQALYIGDSEWSDLQSKDNDAPYSGTASGTAHTSGSTSSPPASGSGAVHDTLDLGSVDDNDWFNRGPNVSCNFF